MSLFAAIELPEAVRTRVGERVARTRDGLPPASWVRAQNLHCTLAFFGEVDPGRVAELTAALRSGVAECAPFAATLGEAGAFPDRGPLRVVWLALQPEERLADLAERVRAAARRSGISADHKPFRSHVTLARCRRPWPARRRADLGGLAGAAPDELPVERAVLMASELGAEGARYRRIAELPLARAA